jgi:hypothetical protein
MVVVFAACALLTYAFLLSKPQDVKVPRYIEAFRFLTSAEIVDIALVAPIHPSMRFHAKMGMTTLSIHHCGGNMHEEMTGAMIAGKILSLGLCWEAHSLALFIVLLGTSSFQLILNNCCGGLPVS